MIPLRLLPTVPEATANDRSHDIGVVCPRAELLVKCLR